MSKFILLTLLLLSLKVAATSQYGDILIMEGDTLTLFSNPLHSRPDWKELSVCIWNELKNEDKRLYPQKYEAEEVEVQWSTACNRGYVAEWILHNDSLFLSNIYACDDFNVKIPLQKLFKDCKNGLLFADWVTQELIVPKGKCILSVNLGYHSVYETEIALYINNGLLTGLNSISNHIALESQFSQSTDPFALNEFIQEHINWNNLPELGNKQIHVSVGVQPDDAGRLANIINDDTYMIYGNEFITDPQNPFIKEAIRMAKLIPDWDVIYQRGKIRSSGIEVIFKI